MSTDTAHETDHPADEHHGPSDMQYVGIFAILVIITAVEVALSYLVDDLGAFFLPLLLILMAVKFLVVVSYFMHLKFDNKIFSWMFYTGLILAITVYAAALFTFKFFSS
jgi:cytochrome c oxidase subunit 4